MNRRWLWATTVTGMVAAAVASTPLAARADYGGGANKNTWQIGISFNCDNRQLCGPDLGGFWGWAELDQNLGTPTTYTGDAKFAFCFHGGTGPGGAGAGSTSEDITSWEVGSNGDFWITGGTELDRYQGQTSVQSLSPFDTGIPAVAGTFHLSSTEIFGFSAPGVSANIQVAYRPAR